MFWLACRVVTTEICKIRTKNYKMRRRKLTQKFIALILLMSLIVATYFLLINLEDLTKAHHNQTAEEHTHFISFCDRIEPNWYTMISNSLRTLDYFESHLHELVTDVAVGARIMEAQLNILLRTTPNLSPTIIRDLEELQRKSNLVGDTVLHGYMSYFEWSRVSDEHATRIKKNLQWIKSASTWETPGVKRWKTLMKSNATIEPAQRVDMATDFGQYTDGCIFGTFENCAIPDYCIDFLWREPHSGYLLTHQILFHYMIVQNDCFSGARKTSYESQNLVEPKQFLETMCHRVITETKLIEALNYPESHQDLFVEQILVCSLAGYNDFLNSNWTNVILDWSAEDGLLGCYTSKSVEKRIVKRRVKRWDNLFPLGNAVCSVHMGALILGVIGQQLRYFLEVCYDS